MARAVSTGSRGDRWRLRSLRRELLRWRDLVAALYLETTPHPAEHAAAFRCLLRFTPGSARQIPLLAATASRDQAGRAQRP